MLSREENEMLTRVHADRPMGRLLRRYWIPALLSEEIPEADCPPIRVRLLGEDLVAFRDSGGRIGLLGEHCAHRGTSLFYGRNEECGLRCIYHGWKYDVQGNVLEPPAEPAGSQLKNKSTIPHIHASRPAAWCSPIWDREKKSQCFQPMPGWACRRSRFISPRAFWSATIYRPWIATAIP